MCGLWWQLSFRYDNRNQTGYRLRDINIERVEAAVNLSFVVHKEYASLSLPQKQQSSNSTSILYNT